MTVVGADNYLDAPLLEVGTSSAYTPNAGYSLQPGEPTAWGSKTAWWKVVPTKFAWHYIDVLYSTGPTRAWVYRSFVSDPTFADLNLVANPGANTQGGWNAAAGGNYYIRLDSDGSDVSYVASVGTDLYDEITETGTLTGARTDLLDEDLPRENYWEPGHGISGPFRETYLTLLDEAVEGAPGPENGDSSAIMHVEQFATEVVENWEAMMGTDWYGADPDDHPYMTFAASSVGSDAITIPDGYDIARARIVLVMSSSDGPALVADPDGEVGQVRARGELEPLQALMYWDDNNSPLGDVEVGATPGRFEFALPAGFGSSTLLSDYNGGTLNVWFVHQGPTTPRPFPAGTWQVWHVGVEFLFRSDEPLPYEPPPPPGLLTVVELYPREDGYGISGGLQLYPEPKSERIYGGRI